MCIIVPNFIKIGQTVAEIWQFNGSQKGGRPPSCICGVQLFWRSERLRDPFCISVANFVIGQTVTEISQFLWFSKWRLLPSWFFKNSKIFYGRSTVGGQCASSCQISSKSVKLLQRYGDRTFFEMAAVRHLSVKPLRRYRDFCDFSRWRPPLFLICKSSTFYR